MPFVSPILITVSIANFILGLLVFLRNRISKLNLIYFLLALSVAIWSVSIYFFRSYHDPNVLLIWAHIAYISAASSSLFFLYLALSFPKEKKIKPLWHGILWAIFLGLTWLILRTDTIISGVILEDGVNGLLFGENYILYGFFLFLAFGGGSWLLLKNYLLSTGIIKVQLRYILIGSIISITLATFTNLILFGLGFFQYNWIGPSATLFWVISIAYAITKHHLFNIKVIATELFTGLLLIILLINAFVSKEFSQLVFNFSIFMGASVVGILLIRSVLWEVKTREQLEQLTKELEKANIELRKADESKTEFLSMASHQLRTSLTATKGYISLALEGQYGKLSRKLGKATSMEAFFVWPEGV